VKRIAGFSPFVWAALGLLVLSACLIALGRRESEAFPATDSFYPSGTAALHDLIARQGFQVAVDRRPNPRLGKNDVAIAFVFEQTTWSLTEEETQSVPPANRNLRKFIEGGGRALVLPIEKGFHDVSRQMLEASVEVRNTRGNLKRKVTPGTGSIIADFLPLDESKAVPVWVAQEPFLSAYRVGKGTAVVASDGLFATNRFVDKLDNAEVLLSALRAVAEPGSRIVFTEATFGYVRSPGFFESVGKWAEAAWFQCLFLFGVIVYTLGRRFGLPDETRPRQRGTRELLDAVSDTYLRARASQAAMGSALQRADMDLRTVLKLPRDASRGERDRLLPESLSRALARLEAATHEKKVHPKDALELIQNVQQELDDFLGPRSAPVARKPALKA
jgi:hypothetical protein